MKRRRTVAGLMTPKDRSVSNSLLTHGSQSSLTTVWRHSDHKFKVVEFLRCVDIKVSGTESFEWRSVEYTHILW